MNLHDLQTSVHVGKDKKNDFGGYNYRTAEGILSAIKAALPDGATIVLSDRIEAIGGQIFLIANAKLTFADGTTADAESAALHPLSKKGMGPSQITGAASSYARKYALSGLMALDDASVDPDARKEAFDVNPADDRDRIKPMVEQAGDLETLQRVWKGELPAIQALPEPMKNELIAAKDARKEQLTSKEAA